jgi:hypothetical protein
MHVCACFLAFFPMMIRQAAWARGVSVQLLIGNWSNSYPPMFPFLRSLAAVNDAIAADHYTPRTGTRQLVCKPKHSSCYNRQRVALQAPRPNAACVQAASPSACSTSPPTPAVPPPTTPFPSFVTLFGCYKLCCAGSTPYTRVNHAKFMVSDSQVWRVTVVCDM